MKAKNDLPKIDQLKKMVQDFEQLQMHLSRVGAADTEPDYHLHRALRDAMGGDVRIPTTADQWELYTRIPGANPAAKKLHDKARKIVGFIVELTVAETPTIFRWLHSYCWRAS